MFRFVNGTRFLGIVSLVAVFSLVSGCGSSDAPQDRVASSATSSVTSQMAVQNTTSTAVLDDSSAPSPIDVVSQFLDRVRRGGQDSDAGILLTQRARSELKRIGRSVQPIGSPDAYFNVTRSEPVPGETESMLVHSIWSEPSSQPTGKIGQPTGKIGQPSGETGQPTGEIGQPTVETGEQPKINYQVVWAVQKEQGQWRISGLAMELQPGQPPTIIDFENGDLMAQLLDDDTESPKSSQPSTSQARCQSQWSHPIGYTKATLFPLVATYPA